MQNIHWRLDNGLLANFRPKLIVLQVGGNNFTDNIHYEGKPSSSSPFFLSLSLPLPPLSFSSSQPTLPNSPPPPLPLLDIAAGISVLLSKIRQLSPASHILLLGVFSATPGSPRFHLNELLAKLGNAESKIKFHEFIEILAWDKESFFIQDGVHLNEAGYAKWEALLVPLLESYGL